MNLSDVFVHVAHKKLVAVDLPDLGSNQHELNGNSALREFFGTVAPIRGTLNWHYFADDAEPLQEDGEFTFYDARAKSNARTKRIEWRFYYYGSFLSIASVGDWFVLAKTQDDRIFALVFQQNSSWLRAAQLLFGVDKPEESFGSIGREVLDSQQLELLQRQILSELDLSLVLPVVPNDEQLMVAKFNGLFPSTKTMSEFARGQTTVDLNNPDEALVRWLDREESLFRALENVIISERLRKGFSDVDDFIGYSLSVQNRRKSRMGFALQNHLAELFDKQRIRYTPQAQTEGKRRPDFIFPSQDEYHDANFNAALLVMLGAKATCKDRWRQVLVEAGRIPNKHLCTLEPGISTQQTKEMQEENVTLVVPSSLHATYTTDQVKQMLSISQFVEILRKKQCGMRN